MITIQEVNKKEFQTYNPNKLISSLSYQQFQNRVDSNIYILFCKELKKFIVAKNRWGTDGEYPLEFLPDFLLKPEGKLVTKCTWE